MAKKNNKKESWVGLKPKAKKIKLKKLVKHLRKPKK